MAGLLRRIRGASSVEDERERLRHAQESAARQLEAMKHELAERVQAVRDRERALDEALRSAPGSPSRVSLSRADGVATNISSRSGAVAAREDDYANNEQQPTPAALAATPSHEVDERKQIEQRLVDLREAERLFLQTQGELASRSEAISARERLLASRERALRDGDSSDRAELTELEARLRRLERAGGTSARDELATFADGLESLRRRGTRRRP